MEQIRAVVDSQLGAAMPCAKISSAFCGTTFIQLWRMHSLEDQRAWLDVMHRNIHLLQSQTGFQSMSLHASHDGKNVAVYAQWDSEEALKRAVEQPDVKVARKELDHHGEPDGAIYSTESVYVSDLSSEQSMQIVPGAAPLTFVNVWTVGDRDLQQKLLSAMKDEAREITDKRGFLRMAFHSSADGKRLVVYAQWESVEAFNLAITNDPIAQASRAKLAHFGEPLANTYKVDSVNLPLTRRPSEESMQKLTDHELYGRCKQRWIGSGFTTRTVRVNGVTLHLAEGGHGDPVLMLHGYPQSGEVWRHVAPELAKHHQVVIPDLRGMGLSESAPHGYDLNNLAEDMHQLVSSLGLRSIKVVAHDWGAAVGAVYAMRYRNEVTHLAFIESALAGAGFESLWNFSKPNGVFAFIPFLLMGESNPAGDTTVELLKGRESIFLRHLWETFTGDKEAAPFDSWSPYVQAMARPGIAQSSSSYYRSAYKGAEQVRDLIKDKLATPVLAIAGKQGIGANHEAFVRAFSNNVVSNVVLEGAGHFVAEERPRELTMALNAFLAAKD